MTVVGWFAIWIVIFFIVGIVFTYRIGLFVELRWPAVGGSFFVLLGLAVLVVSWMAAVQVTGKEQAGCDETYAAAHRLNGSSWSEFRERCIATSRPADWARR